MDTLAYMAKNLPMIGMRAMEHLSIVGVAIAPAIACGMALRVAMLEKAMSRNLGQRLRFG